MTTRLSAALFLSFLWTCPLFATGKRPTSQDLLQTYQKYDLKTLMTAIPRQLDEKELEEDLSHDYANEKYFRLFAFHKELDRPWSPWAGEMYKIYENSEQKENTLFESLKASRKLLHLLCRLFNSNPPTYSDLPSPSPSVPADLVITSAFFSTVSKDSRAGGSPLEFIPRYKEIEEPKGPFILEREENQVRLLPFSFILASKTLQPKSSEAATSSAAVDPFPPTPNFLSMVWEKAQAVGASPRIFLLSLEKALRKHHFTPSDLTTVVENFAKQNNIELPPPLPRARVRRLIKQKYSGLVSSPCPERRTVFSRKAHSLSLSNWRKIRDKRAKKFGINPLHLLPSAWRPFKPSSKPSPFLQAWEALQGQGLPRFRLTASLWKILRAKKPKAPSIRPSALVALAQNTLSQLGGDHLVPESWKSLVFAQENFKDSPELLDFILQVGDEALESGSSLTDLIAAAWGRYFNAGRGQCASLSSLPEGVKYQTYWLTLTHQQRDYIQVYRGAWTSLSIGLYGEDVEEGIPERDWIHQEFKNKLEGLSLKQRSNPYFARYLSFLKENSSSFFKTIEKYRKWNILFSHNEKISLSTQENMRCSFLWNLHTKADQLKLNLDSFKQELLGILEIFFKTRERFFPLLTERVEALRKIYNALPLTADEREDHDEWDRKRDPRIKEQSSLDRDRAHPDQARAFPKAAPYAVKAL